jgi:hypothetical protein
LITAIWTKAPEAGTPKLYPRKRARRPIVGNDDDASRETTDVTTGDEYENFRGRAAGSGTLL